RIDRVAPRVVPAYTLSVEPKQVVEIVAQAAQHRKPLDVLLRVHSYATQQGKVTVGVDAPHGWTASAPVELKFEGAGDEYARFKILPPSRVAVGNYKIAAHVSSSASRSQAAQKVSLSLEPLPTLPTQYWSEPAQC